MASIFETITADEKELDFTPRESWKAYVRAVIPATNTNESAPSEAVPKLLGRDGDGNRQDLRLHPYGSRTIPQARTAQVHRCRPVSCDSGRRHQGLRHARHPGVTSFVPLGTQGVLLAEALTGVGEFPLESPAKSAQVPSASRADVLNHLLAAFLRGGTPDRPALRGFEYMGEIVIAYGLPLL